MSSVPALMSMIKQNNNAIKDTAAIIKEYTALLPINKTDVVGLYNGFIIPMSEVFDTSMGEYTILDDDYYVNVLGIHQMDDDKFLFPVILTKYSTQGYTLECSLRKRTNNSLTEPSTYTQLCYANNKPNITSYSNSVSHEFSDAYAVIGTTKGIYVTNDYSNSNYLTAVTNSIDINATNGGLFPNVENKVVLSSKGTYRKTLLEVIDESQGIILILYFDSSARVNYLLIKVNNDLSITILENEKIGINSVGSYTTASLEIKKMPSGKYLVASASTSYRKLQFITVNPNASAGSRVLFSPEINANNDFIYGDMLRIFDTEYHNKYLIVSSGYNRPFCYSMIEIDDVNEIVILNNTTKIIPDIAYGSCSMLKLKDLNRYFILATTSSESPFAFLRDDGTLYVETPYVSINGGHKPYDVPMLQLNDKLFALASSSYVAQSRVIEMYSGIQPNVSSAGVTIDTAVPGGKAKVLLSGTNNGFTGLTAGDMFIDGAAYVIDENTIAIKPFWER